VGRECGKKLSKVGKARLLLVDGVKVIVRESGVPSLNANVLHYLTALAKVCDVPWAPTLLSSPLSKKSNF